MDVGKGSEKSVLVIEVMKSGKNEELERGPARIISPNEMPDGNGY